VHAQLSQRGEAERQVGGGDAVSGVSVDTTRRRMSEGEQTVEQAYGWVEMPAVAD
jgi:hypothetical protein